MGTFENFALSVTESSPQNRGQEETRKPRERERTKKMAESKMWGVEAENNF